MEYFSPEVIRKYFKAIYIVDISASLLEMAQKRYSSLKYSCYHYYCLDVNVKGLNEYYICQSAD